MKVRGFEKVKSKENEELIMPQAQSNFAAGYDFYVQEDVIIPSSLSQFFNNITTRSDNDKILPTMVKTGIKAYMQDDEYLALYNRSSNPKKLGLIMANSVGVIDKDYYSNDDNDGEIAFPFYNIFPFDITLHKGDRIGQGVFHKFLLTDDDNRLKTIREGGFGSTDKK